jgi:hypothetical protein
VKACLLALSLSLASTNLPGQQDSIGKVRAFIERDTAPLDVERSELRGLLRPDSGTTRADSSFEKWKGGYNAMVDSIGRHLQTEMIQFLIDPEGATGQQIRRNRGDLAMNAPAKARAVADSLRALLERHGVHGGDGEGDMYYSASEAALRREAGPFLTRPLQEFVELLALEDRTPVGGDAALNVSWDELARRLAIADGLVTDHPTLAFGSHLRDRFAAYLNALLGDWDNSSGFSHERPHVFLDDARARLERYAVQHPSTRGGRIANDYVAVLKANDWTRTDAVNAFLGEAMRRAESP